jgi:N-acetylmuramoyl-L-alanine amidase
METTVPTIIDKPIAGKRFEGRLDPASGVQGAPRYVVVHVQGGTNASTLAFFSQPDTQASATVLIGKDGEIWRLIPESDGPWTNGDVQDPTPLARGGILALGGNPNVWSLTVDLEGSEGDEAPEAQLAATVWQIRDWQSRYGIPDENVLRHADINSQRHCPGDALYQTIVSRLSA